MNYLTDIDTATKFVSPTKKIVAISSEDGDVELQIQYPDGHIACSTLQEVAAAIVEFVDGQEWVRDMNESFRLLLEKLRRWVNEHDEVKHWFVIPIKRPTVFLFVVVQSNRKYSMEFSLALSALNGEVASDPRFTSFSMDVQEFPAIDASATDIVKMLQAYGE